MPKNNPDDRDKIFEEIAQRRSASFEEPDGPEEGQQRGDRQRKFHYTRQQRGDIKLALRPKKRSANRTLNKIEMLVGLTAEALQYRTDHPLSPEQEKKFRTLKRPIRQILEILDHPEFKHLKDYLPHLRMELHDLRQMVDLDQRKGPGRPQDPRNAHLEILIEWLAAIWSEDHGPPRRWYSDEKGHDWGPFHRFVHACLKPADVSVSDHVIRSVIEKRISA